MMHPFDGRRSQLKPRPPPGSDLPEAAALGPARLSAAVDVIVDHLRRLVLLQAWEKWQPRLSQGEVASRILERQRLRLEEGGLSDLHAQALGERQQQRGLLEHGEIKHGDAGDDTGCDEDGQLAKSTPFLGEGSRGVNYREAEVGASFPPGPGGRRGRSHLRPPVAGRAAAGNTGANAADSPPLSNTAGGAGGRDSSPVRCLSSPAAVGSRRAIPGDTSSNSNSGGVTHARRRCPSGAHGGAIPTGGAGNLKEGARGLGFSTGAVRSRSAGPVNMQQPQAGDGGGGGGSGGGHEEERRGHSGVRFAPATRIATTKTRETARTTASDGGSGGGGGGKTSMLTMQTCFKEEREAFIRDLRVLHRQLEAKDREHARRERESQAAFARARSEGRAAQERTVALRAEAEAAVAARAEAEARVRVATEGLDRQAAAAETLRARLRHTERLHKEQMDVDRRQQAAAAEEASAERRRLEHSALTARQALSDGRRDWASEKDTLLAAVREAAHRADLACGDSAEAKAHAAVLEERLQQTLEREASLNEEVERLAGSARDGERRAARAVADAERARAAAAAQEEAFLESVKGLEDRAARAEIMQGGERATREDMHTLLEEARQGALTTSSEAQRELTAANLRAVTLGQEASAASAEAEAFRLRAVASEARAGAAAASARDASARLEEALSENRRLTAAAAVEKERLDGQWRRREEKWRLALVRARRGEEPEGETEIEGDGYAATVSPGESVASLVGRRPPPRSKEGRDDAEEGGDKEGARMSPEEVLSELEDLREAVMRLSSDKEHLLGQVARLTTGVATSSTTIGNATAQGLGGSEEGDRCGARRPRRRGSVEWGADDSGTDEDHHEARRKGREGGDAECRQGADGDGCPGSRDRGSGWTRKRQDGEEEEEEEEELLVPRGGPAPMPSRLTTRSGPAGLTRSGGGEGGDKDWGRASPAGRPVAAAALLRSSLERERSLRGREHESLLTLLQEEGVVETAAAAAAAADADHHHHHRCRRRRPAPGTETSLDEPRHGNVSPLARPPYRRRQRQRRRESETHPEEEPEDHGEDEERLDRSGEGFVGSDASATAFAPASAGAEGRAAVPEPLDSEAWDGVLSALEAFLRSHRGCRRNQGENDESSGGSNAAGCVRYRRWRHQERAATKTALAGVRNCSSDDRAGSGRPAGGSRDDDCHRGGNGEVGLLASSSDSCQSPSSSSSSSSSSRALFSADGDGDGSQEEGRHGGGRHQSWLQRRSGRRRERADDRGTATGAAPAAERGDGPTDPDTRNGEEKAAGRSFPASSDEAQGNEGEGGNGEGDGEEAEDRKEEMDAAASEEVNAFSGALAAALRELLSSTLGVPEETLRGAPLPELVGALQREWGALLEGLSAMQEEVNLARRQARDLAASAATSPKEPRTAVPRDELAKMKRRAIELEAALAEARQMEAGVRAEAEAAALEAEDTLKMSESDRSEATSRLAAALRDLAKERADGAVRLAALRTENHRSLSEAEATAAQEAAGSAEAFRRSLEAAVRDGEGRVEELREAVAEARTRAETAEGRVRELEEEVEAAAAGGRGGGEREEGREEGRREAQQRVEALEAALEKLAETGSAAEELSKEQLEITRELSAERDDLMEESERSAARLDQLTTALQEQREEKARLANKLLDREKGLEALRAEGEIERVKMVKLQEEVDKAQGVCREMTDRLLELQATQEELRRTRQHLERSSQELEALRRSKDHLSGGWDEANRLRERLVGADKLCADLSARVAAVEPLAEEESERARHLEVRVEALQRQLDQVPGDLLVAHAEKRVLQGALDQARSQASDVEASVAAELRRRDADARTFASAAALQQERCSERLREQALTIHQLTLQGFSAEASSEARRQRRGQHQVPPSHAASAPAVPAAPAGEAPQGAESRRRVLHPPRRGLYRFDGDEEDAEDRGLWAKGARRRGRSGAWTSSGDRVGMHGLVASPDVVRGSSRRLRSHADTGTRRVDAAGGCYEATGGGEHGGFVWAGHSLDSEFRPPRPAASASLDGRETRGDYRDGTVLDRVSAGDSKGSSFYREGAIRAEQGGRARVMATASRSGSWPTSGVVGDERVSQG